MHPITIEEGIYTLEDIVARLYELEYCVDQIVAAWPQAAQTMPAWWYVFVPVGVIVMFVFSLITFLNVIFSENRIGWFRNSRKNRERVTHREAFKALQECQSPPANSAPEPRGEHDN